MGGGFCFVLYCFFFKVDATGSTGTDAGGGDEMSAENKNKTIKRSGGSAIRWWWYSSVQ